MMTKPATMDKAQSLTMMQSFFQHFMQIMNRPTPLMPNDLEKIMTRNFQLTGNGHILAKTLADYTTRAEKLKKKYSHFEISDLTAEPLMGSNKMVVTYNLNLTNRNGPKLRIHIMAIATAEDNKISRWMEVSNEEGTSRWDA